MDAQPKAKKEKVKKVKKEKVKKQKKVKGAADEDHKKKSSPSKVNTVSKTKADKVELEATKSRLSSLL